MKRDFRAADALRAGWNGYRRANPVTPHVHKAVTHILQCRTRSLGGHIHRCDRCGSEVPVYNSCRDRRCPTCQTAAKEKWLDERLGELLPAAYFHLVFTLPHDLNPLIAANRREVIAEFFSTVNWVLQKFAADPQWKLEGQLGYVAVLHTWTQKLLPHYHIHCLVPGGAWNEERGEWRGAHPKYLFGKDALCAAFRARFIRRLESLRRRGKLKYTGAAAKWEDAEQWDRLIDRLRGVKWVVYPKATSSGPEKVLEYLGRYTHRVAISDRRILDVSDGKVTFTWRDRSDGNIQKECTLPVEQFTARFVHHILPPGFRKIRYMGFLSSRGKAGRLGKIRAALKTEPPENPHKDETLRERILRRTGSDITLCPFCEKGHMERTGVEIPPETCRPP
jgi:hypothetical protein